MIDWKAAAEAPVTEQTGYDELPPKVWCIGATATTENGGAAPAVTLKTFNDSERGRVQYYRFNCGLLVKGGEAALDEKFNDRFMFFASSVHPRDDDDDQGPKSLLHGKVTGFLNAIYAAGVALGEKDRKKKALERWQVTLQRLMEIEKQHPELTGQPINELTGQPDTGLAIMQLAIAGIENDSKLLLFKTGMSRKREGQEQQVQVTQFEDYVPENCTDRKVRLFAAQGVVTPANIPSFS